MIAIRWPIDTAAFWKYRDLNLIYRSEDLLTFKIKDITFFARDIGITESSCACRIKTGQSIIPMWTSLLNAKLLAYIVKMISYWCRNEKLVFILKKAVSTSRGSMKSHSKPGMGRNGNESGWWRTSSKILLNGASNTNRCGPLLLTHCSDTNFEATLNETKEYCHK